jgi:hypothetical protein
MGRGWKKRWSQGMVMGILKTDVTAFVDLQNSFYIN